jgi:hypothetical protein
MCWRRSGMRGAVCCAGTAASRALVRITPWLIGGGACLLPFFAFGHGSEFLEAKFYFDEQRQAHLVVTADYSGNPMLTSQAEAQRALLDCLHVQGQTLVEAVGQPRVELASEPDPDSPMPRTAQDPSLVHEFLVGHWCWRPQGAELRFTVPLTAKQSVLFWLPADKPGSEPRWRIFVPGDAAPPLAVPPAPAAALPWVYTIAGLICGAAGWWGWARWQQRQQRQQRPS